MRIPVSWSSNGCSSPRRRPRRDRRCRRKSARPTLGAVSAGRSPADCSTWCASIRAEAQSTSAA
jgi:hypothetical protein